MFPLFPLWLNLIFFLSHIPCDPASENPSASPAHHVVVSLHFFGQSFFFFFLAYSFLFFIYFY